MSNLTSKYLLSTILLSLVTLTVYAGEPIEMTNTQATGYYKNFSKKWVTCHDPSIVWNPETQKYYIFGSHVAQASTADLQNWTTFRAPWGTVSANGTINSGIANAAAFVTNQTKSITIGGNEIAFGNFNAHDWAAAYGGDYNVDGNMWAPDVIYNEAMQKWCMYLSVNGPHHNSVIILLTADQIDGTYIYQGPVVYTGFKTKNDERISWKKTDLELVLGEQSTLPSRYEHPNDWGDYWANGIDPCVFYDEEGKLWMSYGSWSGGIWMLELDETTGLRDYDVTYTSDYTAKRKGVTQDPYFGKKIAGGYYVSGEASYIEHIGKYYYLFMSYGFFDSVGGYQMRIFRSKSPDGPYVDGLGKSAIFNNYTMNYGPNADTRGQLLMSAYADWGFMKQGELSQGHNSAIAAPDGRSYLVYHTRFNDGTEGHQVRTHQLYLNEKDWLVVSPFEYNGGLTTDTDIATQQIIPTEQIPGVYNLLVHRYPLNYKEREVATPVKITLHADGTVSGAYKGTWNIVEGTSYINIKLGSYTYQGVLVEEQMDVRTIRAITFSACANNGVHIWGYRMRDDYALAYQLNNQDIPITYRQRVSSNIDLTNLQVTDNITIKWTSSLPEIISEGGRYNPAGLLQDTLVELTAHISAGDYYWEKDYTVIAKAEEYPSHDWKTGAVAYYDFDNDINYNWLDSTERAYLLKAGTNSKPTLESDDIRNGKFVHITSGKNGNESYVSIPNPLLQKEIEEGITLSFWTRRDDSNNWDALFAFYNKGNNARLYMTGGGYIGYNNNAGNWLDINHPDSYKKDPIGVNKWHLVTITISRKSTSGITLYIDGTKVSGCTYNGNLNGSTINKASAFDYNLLVDHITTCSRLTFGYGSFWGSPNACFDDVILHNRVLSRLEVSALKQMMNRVYNLGEAVGIKEPPTFIMEEPSNGIIYDLSGRRVISPNKGIYIINGKKVMIK